jgi:hypothetical protein
MNILMIIKQEPGISIEQLGYRLNDISDLPWYAADECIKVEGENGRLWLTPKGESELKSQLFSDARDYVGDEEPSESSLVEAMEKCDEELIQSLWYE